MKSLERKHFFKKPLITLFVTHGKSLNVKKILQKGPKLIFSFDLANLFDHPTHLIPFAPKPFIILLAPNPMIVD
jgi:hypothetical protein